MRAEGHTVDTEKVLKELESFATYDKEKGGFKITHLSRGHRPPIGESLGTLTNKGYLYAKVHKVVRPIHHLVWLWHYGYFPQQIDHIDRNKQNNRIDNLREADTSINNLNKAAQSNNKLGCSNVRRLPNGKFNVRVCEISYGTFNTLDEAIVKRDFIKQRKLNKGVK